MLSLGVPQPLPTSENTAHCIPEPGHIVSFWDPTLITPNKQKSRRRICLWWRITINNITSVEKHYTVQQSPVDQGSSSTASKTSDEKFKLTKTLFSIASTLSSKQTLSWLIRLLSDVGLMTIMRGTPWGDLGSLVGIFPKWESKESLLWWSMMLPFFSLESEISSDKLWLRFLVRISRGRVAMVRELQTRSWSQYVSFMVDGCWQWEKKTSSPQWDKIRLR